MKATVTPATTKQLTISAPLQRLFLLILVVSWLVPVAVMTYSLQSNHLYLGSGTLLFQMSYWALPIAYAALALGFVWRNYRSLRERAFVASIIGTIGLFAYQSIQQVYYLIINQNSWLQPRADDDSLWNAFGSEWALMLICLALYVGVLGFVKMKQDHAR